MTPERNHPLVSRNTGDDYFEKLAGARALYLSTRHITSLEVVDFETLYRKGMVIKVGAGVHVFEAAEQLRIKCIIFCLCPKVYSRFRSNLEANLSV